MGIDKTSGYFSLSHTQSLFLSLSALISALISGTMFPARYEEPCIIIEFIILWATGSSEKPLRKKNGRVAFITCLATGEAWESGICDLFRSSLVCSYAVRLKKESEVETYSYFPPQFALNRLGRSGRPSSHHSHHSCLRGRFSCHP